MFKNFKTRSQLGLAGLVYILSFQASADLTPDIGARGAVVGAQDLLVSPPLPSLEAGGKTSISPQMGYLVARVDGVESPGTLPLTYKGDLQGYSLGFGLTSRTYGRFGWFLIAVANSITGGIQIVDQSSTIDIKDIQSKAYAGAGGLSYRFMGESSSPMAAGIFLGPSLMKVTSSFKLTRQGNDPSVDPEYSMDELIYGLYGGVQVKWRIQRLVLNPYALYMKELSPECKKMQIKDAPGFTTLCESDPLAGNSVTIRASFSGYGLILGWSKLRFNVYSKAIPDKNFRDVAVTNYTLSYMVEMD